MSSLYAYNVTKLNQSFQIDGNWDKSPWDRIDSIELTNFMGRRPGFFPTVQARMAYDDAYIYVIFLVKDRYIRCITNEINGPVWEDACVEFFFAPSPNLTERYFNLEVNCGGTPLMHYNIVANKEIKAIEEEDIRRINIAHSLPRIVDPELTNPVDWTIEYSIPIQILKKYADITSPGAGVTWRGNFFKIAENNSNPHFLTWSFVDHPEPDFHIPEFFGLLRFN